MAVRRVVKAVLIDLSGTLHIEDSAVPGAQEALASSLHFWNSTHIYSCTIFSHVSVKLTVSIVCCCLGVTSYVKSSWHICLSCLIMKIFELRRAPVNVKFVTNTTKESKRILFERLKRLEFDIEETEIFTSLTAARSLVEQQNVRPLLMVENSALEDFSGIETSDPNAVVIGLAPDHFNYQTMNKAFRLILDGAPLIAIHKARYYKRKDGLALGPGPFVTGLEYATDTKATVVGKPERTFFLEAVRNLDCKPEEAIVIGDDVRDDIGGAQNSGMMGILVKTGKYRQGDEVKINPPPYLTCDSFLQAVDHILQNLI
ncbi:HDHD2 protein, partial [Atractosteus spatula]|nr:HDHD2 protein [Atractosteus spatula]